MEKRISCRGIIFIDNNLAVMHRVKKDRDYYVFPGGGVEEDDITKEEAVKREIKEEFGIDVNPQKLVYVYENGNTIQYYYLCEKVGGSFGTGEGPEIVNFLERKGFYLPDLINIDRIKNINLEPQKLSAILLEDINTYGLELNSEVTSIEDDDDEK